MNIEVFQTDMEKSPAEFRLVETKSPKYLDQFFNTANTKDSITGTVDTTIPVEETDGSALTPIYNSEAPDTEDVEITHVSVKSEFEDEVGLTRMGSYQSNFCDISLGGCSFSLDMDICEELDIPKNKIFFKIALPFERGSVPVLAKLINIRPNVNNAKKKIHGCQFFNVSRKSKMQLKQEILLLERAQIRELISLENQSRKMGLI